MPSRRLEKWLSVSFLAVDGSTEKAMQILQDCLVYQELLLQATAVMRMYHAPGERCGYIDCLSLKAW